MSEAITALVEARAWSSVRWDDLYGAYQMYCQERGMKAVDECALGRGMRGMGFGLKDGTGMTIQLREDAKAEERSRWYWYHVSMKLMD